MLHKETISDNTYTLLKQIMKDDFFKGFFLVGGTAISLQIGHRISADLDLFTQGDIDIDDYKHHLIENYNFKAELEKKNTLKGFIGETFTDFISYGYPLIDNIITEDGIRLLSLKDIIPMKLVTIIQSEERMKDFIDIAYLSSHYSLNDMISFYKQKYGNDNELSIYKALIYFDSIDVTENVKLINKQLDFKTIKNRLIEMTKNPEKVFTAL